MQFASSKNWELSAFFILAILIYFIYGILLIPSAFEQFFSLYIGTLSFKLGHMLIPIFDHFFHSVQFSSVAQSCPTLCDSMNCSTPVLLVYDQLLEFTQTHVHQVSDVIQPSHPLSSPSPLALNPSHAASGSFPMSQLFTWGGQSTGVSTLASVLPKNTQGWSPLEWTGWISLQSKGSLY